MWLYLLIFIIPVVLYLLTIRTGETRNTVALAVYLAGLGLFVGMGDMLGGYDRYIYCDVFDTISNVTNLNGNYYVTGCFEFFPSESGWTILNVLISFYTENRYIFILSITLLTYTLLFISLRRCASNYPLALILFMGLWFYFTFTYLRQVLGATFVWLSIPYILKRRIVPFCVIVFLAWTIHKSAILFFPTYFLVTHSFSRKQILWLMVIALLVGVSPIPNALFDTYGDISQIEMHEDYNASGGFRIEYFFEAAFFLFLLLYNYGEEEMDDTRRVMFNLSCIFCAALLFFIRSENGGRTAWYFMIGIICTLTDMANKEENRRTLAPLLIIVCLLLNMRIYTSWQSGNFLYPYKTFLSNGYRPNDKIRDMYEYDYSYDNDKFYRDAFRIKTNFEGLNKVQN